MRHAGPGRFALIALAMSGTPALAEGAPPATTACPEALNSVATCYL